MIIVFHTTRYEAEFGSESIASSQSNDTSGTGRVGTLNSSPKLLYTSHLTAWLVCPIRAGALLDKILSKAAAFLSPEYMDMVAGGLQGLLDKYWIARLYPHLIQTRVLLHT